MIIQFVRTNEIFYVYYKLYKPFNALWIESFYDFISVGTTDKNVLILRRRSFT